MRFLSLLITLSIIGYAISVYLDSGDLTSADPDKVMSKPKEFIDHAQQAADQINSQMQRHKDKLDQRN